MNAPHDLRWVPLRRGLVRLTPWGWLAYCVGCGWAQGGLAGTRAAARRAYHAHKEPR